jgi:hypothetical protein
MESKTYSESAFRALITKYPYLSSVGLMTQEYSRNFSLYFEASRNALFKEYRAFKLALDWLANCRTMNIATENSLKSSDLCDLLGKYFNAPMPHGAFIAAVLYLEIPFFRETGAPYIHIGISKFCPHYQTLRHYIKKNEP